MAQPVEGPAGRWHRPTVAAVAGLVTIGIAAFPLGLVSGRPFGVEDNGDGRRLYCGIGLYPQTVDRVALWKGGFVTDFGVGPPSCGLSMPSSAALVLRAAALGRRTVTLEAVAWWYVVLVGLAVATCAWAASASRCRRAAVLVVPVAPLVLVPFSRFFVSAYAEPAGLVGTVMAGCGLAALVAAGPDQRVADRVALAVTLLGATVAATAKSAYVPVFLLVAVALALFVRRRAIAAVLAVAVVAIVLPVWGAMAFQRQVYEGANVHDLVFTLALTELGPDATVDLDLPPEAAATTGIGFFNGPPLPTSAWWRDAILDRPGALRTDAVVALVRTPTALLRAVGVGLQATTGADLPYLASGPADPARFSAPGGSVGWSGSSGPELRAVLDRTGRPPWLPTALVLVALGAAASTPAWRSRAPGAARWCRGAGLGAATALGLVVTALLGDGYFEVFKHVWLAAYVLLVTALCLVAAVGSLVVSSAHRRRRGL